ncbi:MAG: cation transporter [Alphaproteobacteria bacterium]
MGAGHDHGSALTGAGNTGAATIAYARRVLWIALILNAGMFVFEAAAGLAADSVALQADALDFLSDSATYAISLAVLSRPPRWRAGAAFVKGASLGLFGLWVAGATLFGALRQPLPVAEIMAGVGILALAVNVAVAVMLFGMRRGDANMRSVWLCSRNDAIGNLAVILAAFGVFGTATVWPDLAVAGVMAALALTASVSILRQATGEWRASRPTR